VAACEGIEPGLHYYDPRGHSLVPIRARTPEVEGLLGDAADSAGISPDAIQVLLIVSARLPRLSWKYASIAYALVLKHVGVVLHSMYLAATAMGLAPCALGAGDSDLFARAAGTDYYAETSVGEFLLGSRRVAESPPRGPGRACVERTASERSGISPFPACMRNRGHSPDAAWLPGITDRGRALPDPPTSSTGTPPWRPP